MNKSLFLVSLILSQLNLSNANASELSAKEIMLKNEAARKIDNLVSQATLVTGPKSGDGLKSKTFTWWRKLSGDKTHYNTLTRFHEPAEVRGEGILFLEHDEGKNEILLYLPSFKKIRRVENSQQSGSFMGSEFSYTDIATPHINDYKYVLIKSEKCPGLTNTDCYVVEATPINDEIKERTGYLRSVQWIAKTHFMVVYAEDFGLDGQLFKKFWAKKIEQVVTGHWMSRHIEVDNLKNQKSTSIDFLQINAKEEISDSIFSQQNLMRE